MHVQQESRAFCTVCKIDWPYTKPADNTICALVCPHCHVTVFGCTYCEKIHFYNDKKKFKQHVAQKTTTPPVLTQCKKCFNYLVTTLPPPNSPDQICYDCITPTCNTQFFQCGLCTTKQYMYTSDRNLKQHKKKFHQPNTSTVAHADPVAVAHGEPVAAPDPTLGDAHTSHQQDDALLAPVDNVDNDSYHNAGGQDVDFGDNNDAPDDGVDNDVDDGANDAGAIADVPPVQVVDPIIPDDEADAMPWRKFKQVFRSRRNQHFFYQEYLHNTLNGGIAGIVYRAFHKRMQRNYVRDDISLSSTELGQFCTRAETSFMIDLCKLLHTLNPENTGLLATNNTTLIRAVPAGTLFNSITPPTTTADYDRYCLVNQQAIMPNLPIEKVFTIDNHACIKLNDKINHVMGHGISLGWYCREAAANNFGLNKSRAMKRAVRRMRATGRMRRSTKIGYLILFSDAFQRCFVRTKNNGVWILTVTICPPDGTKFSIWHSHVIAVGKKSWDHSSVICAVMQELDKIRRGVWRYCAITKTMVHTMFDVIMYVADRPERNFVSSTMERGLYTKLWKYSTKFTAAQMKSCPTCLAARVVWLRSFYHSGTVTAIPSTNNCAQCRDWNRVGRTAPFQSPVPPQYPTTVHHQSPPPPKRRKITPTAQPVLPVKHDFDYLQKGCKYAYYNIATGTWTQPQFKAYAQVLGINGNLQTKLLHNAAHRDDVDVTAMELNALPLPTIYKHPSNIDMLIDSPMHLLFLGVVKAVIDAARAYATTKLKAKRFVAATEHPMEVLRLFQLNYLRMTGFTNSTSKKNKATGITSLWLSDNYMAFERVSPYLFGLVIYQVLPHRDDSADDVACRNALAKMMTAMFVMISHIMSPWDPHPSVIEQHVRFFLQSCVEYSALVTDEDQQQFWEGKANFVSLLNLSHQIVEFGPIRLYWDGDYERHIQIIKPTLVCLRGTKGYFTKRMEHLLQDHLLDMFARKYRCDAAEDGEDAEEWWKPVQKYRGNKAHVYATIADVREAHFRRRPMSGFYVPGHSGYMVAVGTKERHLYYQVDFNHDGFIPHNIMGLFYEHCTIGERPFNGWHYDLKGTLNSATSCLFLPTPDKNRLGNSYAVVLPDWRIRRQGNVIGLPQIPNEMM